MSFPEAFKLNTENPSYGASSVKGVRSEHAPSAGLPEGCSPVRGPPKAPRPGIFW